MLKPPLYIHMAPWDGAKRSNCNRCANKEHCCCCCCCCSFAERADWAADAVSQLYGFMFVVVVGMVLDCVREGVFGCLF